MRARISEGTLNNQKQELIKMYIKEHEQCKQIDRAREKMTMLNTSDECVGELQMRNINQKLNRLEKSLMRSNSTTFKQSNSQQTNIAKYEELNCFNDKINHAINRLSSNNRNLNIDNIRMKVITLYNKSVSVLTNRDRLSKKLTHLNEQKENRKKQVEQTKKQIELTSLELNSIKACNYMSAMKMQSVQTNFMRLL